ncbi:hypothetical protein ABK040_009660 [Willaertia magna]
MYASTSLPSTPTKQRITTSVYNTATTGNNNNYNYFNQLPPAPRNNNNQFPEVVNHQQQQSLFMNLGNPTYTNVNCSPISNRQYFNNQSNLNNPSYYSPFGTTSGGNNLFSQQENNMNRTTTTNGLTTNGSTAARKLNFDGIPNQQQAPCFPMNNNNQSFNNNNGALSFNQPAPHHHPNVNPNHQQFNQQQFYHFTASSSQMNHAGYHLYGEYNNNGHNINNGHPSGYDKVIKQQQQQPLVDLPFSAFSFPTIFSNNNLSGSNKENVAWLMNSNTNNANSGMFHHHVVQQQQGFGMQNGNVKGNNNNQNGIHGNMMKGFEEDGNAVFFTNGLTNSNVGLTNGSTIGTTSLKSKEENISKLNSDNGNYTSEDLVGGVTKAFQQLNLAKVTESQISASTTTTSNNSVQNRTRRSSYHNNNSGTGSNGTTTNIQNKHYHQRASSSNSIIGGTNNECNQSGWHEPFVKQTNISSVHPNGYSSVPNSPSKHRRNGSMGNSGGNTTNNNNNKDGSNSNGSNSPPTSPTKKETTADKSAYKDIQQVFKNQEKSGYENAKQFIMSYLNDPSCPLGIHMHWRVYMDLADFAKRENLLSEARKQFSKVNKLQPAASQGWLEHAKLEEECGNYEKCGRLLLEGLDKCKNNESLLIKAIKHFEQTEDLETARALLSRLKNQKPENCWKILLEGALLESRAGNVNIARKVFRYLMKNVPRHGPIYYEAFRLEEKCEQFEQALNIVEQGLIANPRYGPLWFAAFRLYERKFDKCTEQDRKEHYLNEFRQCISRAVNKISKELKWKVYFELAQFEERANNLQLARKAYTKSAVKALDNLRWKVWLAGSRTELNAGNIEIARVLLSRALQEVPIKTKAVVLIECARLEEFCGNLEKAREFLCRAKQETKHEWKVFLESILLEMRAGDIESAILEAEEALQVHRGTGRLWAVLIQLKHMQGDTKQCHKVFKEALEEVPKSGEVWCEGARIALNPLSVKFSLEKAKRYLNFAIKFTPQYGDSFIEYLRLELLTRGPSIPSNNAAAPNNNNCTTIITTTTNTAATSNLLSNTNGNGNMNNVAIQEYIEHMCVNADPNYGPLWFHCKNHPLDSTRQVLRRAKDLLMAELVQHKDIYQKAIMNQHSKKINKKQGDLHSAVEIQKFITGLCALNQMFHNSKNLSFEMRKKYIYGNEISV